MLLDFPEKKRYEGIQFNVISVTRGWVGVNFPGEKCHVMFTRMAPKGGVGGKVYGSQLRICTGQRDQCTVTSRLTDPTLGVIKVLHNAFFLANLTPTHPS